MPRYTIDVTDTANAGLQDLVNEYNAGNGTALTIADWLDLHIRELAIQRQLTQDIETLRRQGEQATAAAIVAKRLQLMETVTRSA